MTNRTNIINANSLHTDESLRRWASCCFSQTGSRMLATVLEWLTDFLTGAIMESRKAVRSKAVASPPWTERLTEKPGILGKPFRRRRIRLTAIVGNCKSICWLYKGMVDKWLNESWLSENLEATIDFQVTFSWIVYTGYVLRRHQKAHAPFVVVCIWVTQFDT